MDGGDSAFIPPQMRLLVAPIEIQLFHQLQQHGQHMLRDGESVGASGVGQQASFPQDLRIAVCPGSVQLDPPQLGGVFQHGGGDISQNDVRILYRCLRRIHFIGEMGFRRNSFQHFPVTGLGWNGYKYFMHLPFLLFYRWS